MLNPVNILNKNITQYMFQGAVGPCKIHLNPSSTVDMNGGLLSVIIPSDTQLQLRKVGLYQSKHLGSTPHSYSDDLKIRLNNLY